MKTTLRNQEGFTFVEVMLVVVIIVILLGVTAPLYLSFVASNDLTKATESVPFAVRYARIRTEGMLENSVWNVHITEGAITIYKGVDFATRDTAKDISYAISDSVTVTGDEDIFLESFTGLPQETYTTTLQSRNNKIKVITVNEEGVITIQ